MKLISIYDLIENEDRIRILLNKQFMSKLYKRLTKKGIYYINSLKN